MLTCEYRHSLDAKNRLFIPAKHRELLGESFMVARSVRENCLIVYSEEEWNRYIAPLEELPRKDYEKAIRFIYRNAMQAVPDSQGRIVLNDGLIEHAELKKNAVIVGCGKYAEIWAEEVYDKVAEEENPEEVRAALEKYGL